MDTEEILGLEVGRDMDFLVATRVMGYNPPNKHNTRFYSTAIEDAWEVIEKIQSEWSWEISCCNTSQEVDVRIGRAVYTSRSASKAICMAALLATSMG